MRRKISILLVLLLLCAFLNGCSGEKSVSKVELPAVVPESPAQESVTPESTAQDLPEQNNSAPSQADVELDVPDAPEGKTTLVLGGIGLRDDTLASLVNNFNAENTKYTVVIDDYAENTQSREQAETVMQTKLFAGDAADIYYFRNDMLSPLPWISAGLLYDLDPLIASDSEISEEDIIPWTAMHEYGCAGMRGMGGDTDSGAERETPTWRAIHGWIVRRPHTKNNDTCVSHTSQNGTPRHQHGGRCNAYGAVCRCRLPDL